MKPEAAIVNVYAPGDTLSLHRDVSEASDRGLVSISLGCEAIFVVGLGGGAEEEGEAGEVARHAAMRLRSGDAVYMCGSARFAWHGVPQIVPGTCPEELRSWPAPEGDDEANGYEAWRGWMAAKRVNLNVRQMNP
jgi:alkylated DNA repair dioxygenase AlkB